MWDEDAGRERADLMARISRFEDRMAAATITGTSPCGRVTVVCDHTGAPVDIELSDDVPHAVSRERLASVLITTLASANRAATATRDRFYGQLTVAGDTVANWVRHPPPPRSRAAMTLSFLDTVRAGFEARSRDTKGCDHVEG